MTNNVMTDDRAQVAAAKTDRVMEPCALVLFGASGDLAQRMVMPAIFRLARRGLLQHLARRRDVGGGAIRARERIF